MPKFITWNPNRFDKNFGIKIEVEPEYAISKGILAIVGRINLYLQRKSKISSEKPKKIIKQIDNNEALYSKCLFSVKFKIVWEIIETTKNTVAGTIPRDSGLKLKLKIIKNCKYLT